MRRIVFYSALLLGGMVVSQGIDLSPWTGWLHVITQVCLAYIMVEVGLEFSAEEVNLRRYAVDYAVAGGAAVLPWFLCAVYLVAALKTPWGEGGLISLFAAPTSAGVLFTMMAAAGLGGTWVFKKARVLAIFDDLQTLLLMIPLQILWVGLRWQLIAVIGISLGLLVTGYLWINRLLWPIGKPWLLLYGIGTVLLCAGIEHLTSIRLEVLLPAFVLGCLVRHHATVREGDDPHSWIDQTVKGLFMALVGCSLPRIVLGSIGVGTLLAHVLALTVLSNIGKCFPLLFYRQEASLRERLALSVAMFPRGEVGAGILLIALGYGMGGLAVAVGTLSLALNLLLTGGFIRMVTQLTGPRTNT